MRDRGARIDRARASKAASCALLFALSAVAAEAPNPAVVARLAPNSLLLDVVRPDADRLVAVGERGHVLLSADGGRHWRQAAVPVDATLTSVCFSDPKRGWAVGHDEVILATVDGGANWTLQHYAPQARQPLLSVVCGPEGALLAVGAFATTYRSGDGGRSWRAANFESSALLTKPSHQAVHAMADDDDSLAQPHLNAVARAANGHLYIAAEAGHLYRSDDQGMHWWQLPSPYQGSFFGVLPLAGDTVLAFGLRGHLYRSTDAGRSWLALDSGTDALLAGGTAQPGGRVVIVGQAGTILISTDGGQTFHAVQRSDRKGLSAVTTSGNSLVTVGEAGVRMIAAEEH